MWVRRYGCFIIGKGVILVRGKGKKEGGNYVRLILVWVEGCGWSIMGGGGVGGGGGGGGCDWRKFLATTTLKEGGLSRKDGRKEGRKEGRQEGREKGREGVRSLS